MKKFIDALNQAGVNRIVIQGDELAISFEDGSFTRLSQQDITRLLEEASAVKVP